MSDSIDRDRLIRAIAESLLDEQSDVCPPAVLTEWLEADQNNSKIYERICNAYLCKPLADFNSYDPQADWTSVMINILFRRRRSRILKTVAAAAIAFVAGVSLTLLVTYTGPVYADRIVEDAEEKITGNAVASIVEGDKERIIEVVDKIIVDDPADASLPDDHTAAMILPDGNGSELDGDIDSEVENIKNKPENHEYISSVTEQRPVLHTLITHKGMEYAISLSDGSTVRLNAGSEFSYPEVFPEGRRTVTLVGEAFFDVNQDPDQPFVIQCGDMKVRVSGTTFNLKAYRGESRKATLVSGEISVELDGHMLNVSSGQQVCETDDGLVMTEVNVDDHLGWINDRFIFKGVPLKEAMKDIARWYDIGIEFADDEISELHLTANIPRYERVDKVFDIIRQAVYVEIADHGDVVIVASDTPQVI